MKTSRQVEREAGQLFRLCLVDGLLEEGRVRQVVRWAIQTKRRSYLAFLSDFIRLVRLDRAAHTATIETAVPLPAGLQAKVRERLARVYGPGTSTQFRLEPALIGGMRIKVGCDVYDGSVQGELTALEARF
jgi:F-type H+-transporting ATPase subunit delta